MMQKFAVMTGLVLAMTASANAGTLTAMITDVSDPNNPVSFTVVDGDSNDGDMATPGLVTLGTTTVGNWTISNFVGTSTINQNQLTLGSLVGDYTGPGTGMLIVKLSDTGFTAPTNPVLNSTSGGSISIDPQASGTISVDFEQWVDDADQLFGQSELIDHGTFTNNTNASVDVGDALSSPVSLTGGYSLTEWLKVTTDTPDSQASVTLFSVVTPEPASMALLAMGGLMIGMRRR